MNRNGPGLMSQAPQPKMKRLSPGVYQDSSGRTVQSKTGAARPQPQPRQAPPPQAQQFAPQQNPQTMAGIASQFNGMQNGKDPRFNPQQQQQFGMWGQMRPSVMPQGAPQGWYQNMPQEMFPPLPTQMGAMGQDQYQTMGDIAQNAQPRGNFYGKQQGSR